MDAALFVLVLAAAGVNFELAESGAVGHTAPFASQAGWSPERYQALPAASATHDRYQGPPTGSAGVGPPPSVADRARTAVTETANTLRDGVEAGIQAANEQLSRSAEQMVDTTRTAGQGFAQEFQGWSGLPSQPPPQFGSQRSTPPPSTSGRRQVSNPFVATAPAPATSQATPPAGRTRSGVAPPPWTGAATATEPDWPAETANPKPLDRTAALGAGPARLESGWSSISSEIAPPALMVPPLANDADKSLLRQPSSNVGPSFPTGPAEATSAAPPAATAGQPTGSSDAAGDGWALGWGTTQTPPATIGRYETASTTAPAQQDRTQAAAAPAITGPRNVPESSSQATAPDRFDPWGDNEPWSEPVNPATEAPPTGSVSQAEQPPNSPASGQPAAAVSSQPPVTAPQLPGAATDTSATPSPSHAASNDAAPVDGQKTSEEPPWVPLLVTSLSLAGSLGANLFLGWSYMDARQRYRSLVQKTANKFRRAAA